MTKPARRQGLLFPLLSAAVDYARSQGAQVIEGYPRDSSSQAFSTEDAFVGTTSAFRAAGFERQEQRHGKRLISRWVRDC